MPTWRARDVTREIDLVEEVARFELDRRPVHAAAREAMFGRLTPGQQAAARGRGRARRLRLVGGVHAEPRRRRSGSGGDPASRAAVERAARCATTLLPSLVEAARANRDVGVDDVALFEIARVYLPTGERCRTSGGTSRASSRAGSREAKGAVEQLYAALGTSSRVRAATRALPPSRQGGADGGGLGRRAPSGGARRRLGRVRARPRRARSAACRSAIGYRGRERRIPSCVQDLAFVVDEDVRGRARRGDPRGGRRAPARRVASSTSTAARRSARGSARSRSGSRSARPSGR